MYISLVIIINIVITKDFLYLTFKSYNVIILFEGGERIYMITLNELDREVSRY